jgi:Do/DeqQ family serine protease
MARRFFASSVLIVIGVLAGVLLTGRLQSRTDDPAPPPPAEVSAAQAASTPAATAGLPDFTQIAARTAPSIVNISAVQVYRRPYFQDPLFGRLFGDDLSSTRRGTSAGSGVIIASDGYVLTNNHVLGENPQTLQQVAVILADKRERPAELVGVDPYTDLALLRIKERNLPAVTWGDSGTLRVAEWVLAIGNPYQLGQTVTLGIVSGMNRTYQDVSALVDYIQTDAAINPGNSGGALINRRGELVGINTWIYSQSGGDQGIGFAIPSNLARRVADELRKTGQVRRGSIGAMRLAAVTPELARDLSLTEAKGALVWEMSQSSSAYRAGVRPGDVIVAVDGKRTDEPSQVQRSLLEAPIGSVVTISLLRDGRPRDVKVQVEGQAMRRRNAAE